VSAPKTLVVTQKCCTNEVAVASDGTKLPPLFAFKGELWKIPSIHFWKSALEVAVKPMHGLTRESNRSGLMPFMSCMFLLMTNITFCKHYKVHMMQKFVGGLMLVSMHLSIGISGIPTISGVLAN
jgi:hypothetical protein